MKATCTWGDGPDVLLNAGSPSKDGLYDLTAKQARELAGELLMAANRANELDQIAEDHDELVAQ